MSQAALLTWHGMLLCAETDGRLVQRSLHQAHAAVTVRMPGGLDPFALFLAGSSGPEFPPCAGPLASYVARGAGRRRAVRLSRGSEFLSANPDGLTSSLVRGQEHDTLFLAIPLADLPHIRTILSNDWLLCGDGRMVSRDAIGIERGHALRFGPLLLDIADHLPFDGYTMPHRFAVHHDAGRIEQARLYRPLVYFTAFRDTAIFDQLRIALESLVDVGAYSGSVLLLTDERERLHESAMAIVEPSRAFVQHVSALDRTAAVAARYAIVDWRAAITYQPVLYCDTDVVFDTPVEGMLRAVLACDRIAAPAEPFSALKDSVSVGADLIAADGIETRYAVGFNAGTLGIPSLAAHGDTLRLIRRILVNRADLHGRPHRGFVDQPLANYVAFRTGGFDTATLSRFVRFGWSGIGADAASRRGLVHFFFPRGARAKYDAMRAYQAALPSEAAYAVGAG